MTVLWKGNLRKEVPDEQAQEWIDQGFEPRGEKPKPKLQAKAHVVEPALDTTQEEQ